MSEPGIYLDYAATTPVDPRVAEEMASCLTREGDFGNPASMQHSFGRNAHARIERARAEVADIISAEPAEMVFTSGATESNNLALKGVAEAYADRGRHIVSMKTEHKSVIDSLRHLEQKGWRITWLEPELDGRLSVEMFTQALAEDTVLASIMLVNNETGVVQNIEALARIAHEHGVLLHVDAAQGVGKLPVDVRAMNVDLLSLSAHKLYGPKGVGALYVRRQPRVRLAEQMHGGGHERGMRSGTLAVHQVVGMGSACRLASIELDVERARLQGLRDKLWQGLSALPEVLLNGSEQDSIPGILNLSVGGVDGEALHAGISGMAVPIAISSGSACTAASQEASYVLRALGRDDELAYASLRLSMGRWTSEAEIEQVVAEVSALVNALRARSARWLAACPDAQPKMASVHPQYSNAVWQYFIRGLQQPLLLSQDEGLSIRCETPGSRAVLNMTVTQVDGRVERAEFKVYGCVSAYAAATWLCEWLEGKSLADAELSTGEIEQALQLAPIKRHCALMAEDALGMLKQLWSQSIEVAEQAAL